MDRMITYFLFDVVSREREMNFVSNLKGLHFPVYAPPAAPSNESGKKEVYFYLCVCIALSAEGITSKGI